MKRNCFLIIFLFCTFLLFSQSSNDDLLKLRLLDFFENIVSKETTIDSLIEKYGKPDNVLNKSTGYLDDKIITYSYENIGDFNFFYKTNENKIYFWSVNLNNVYINEINFPITMEGVDNYFNTKFTRIDSHLTPGNVYIGYFGEFSVNFIFKETDEKLYQINWILH